jgi:hypothetical protein
MRWLLTCFGRVRGHIALGDMDVTEHIHRSDEVAKGVVTPELEELHVLARYPLSISSQPMALSWRPRHVT